MSEQDYLDFLNSLDEELVQCTNFEQLAYKYIKDKLKERKSNESKSKL